MRLRSTGVLWRDYHWTAIGLHSEVGSGAFKGFIYGIIGGVFPGIRLDIFVRDEGVGSSNLPTPTNKINDLKDLSPDASATGSVSEAD